MSAATALDVRLDMPLPAALPAGAATVLFCVGSCTHAGGDAIDALALDVDGTRQRPDAWGMPRADRGGARSGFWASVPVRMPAHAIELDVVASLAGGGEERAPLGRVEVEAAGTPGSHPAAAPSRGTPIAICMATFEPDPELFDAQVESLRAQTATGWTCLVSDDCSSPGHRARIERAIGGDERFVLSFSERRLGFYRNFERALAMVPPDAELVALCDQDDRWHPDKLAVLRETLGGGATLAYSDQRLVDAGGRVLRDTMWRGRSNNHTSLVSMLVANTITGAATLFRRELLDLLLPFPETPGFQFHDHWLALGALAAGEVAYVDRPLYDYVQHAGAVFGDVSSGARADPPRTPGLARRWRAAYFHGYLPRAVQARVLLLRGGGRIDGRKRGALERFLAAERSPLAWAWLAARPLRELAGRSETLGSERQLAAGILWSWLARTRLGRLDAAPPPPGDFSQARLRRWRADV